MDKIYVEFALINYCFDVNQKFWISVIIWNKSNSNICYEQSKSQILVFKNEFLFRYIHP